MLTFKINEELELSMKNLILSMIDVRNDTVKYEKSLIKHRTLLNMDFHKPMGKYLTM